MPWSAIIAENVWWVCAAIFMGVRLPHYRRAWREPVKDHRRTVLDRILVQCAYAGYGYVPFAYVLFKVPPFGTYPFLPPLLALGTVVIVCAIWVMHRAHRDLALFFSTKLEIREQHRVVTSGIYHYVRHPMYVAFMLLGIAQAMLIPNWIAGFSGLVAGVLLFGSRISREENMMLQTCGDDYRAYMATTARFVPGVF
jgi:protein-S-isoprenylcysteine O-methyltransferase Ste14